MKKYLVYIILVISLIANVGMVLKFLILGDVVDIKDGRMAVMLTEKIEKLFLLKCVNF